MSTPVGMKFMSAITWFELLSPKPTPLPACSVHTVEQCGILGMYAAHCVRSLSVGAAGRRITYKELIA